MFPLHSMTIQEYEAKRAIHTHTDMILWLNIIQKFYAKPGKIIEWTVKIKPRVGLHRQIIVSVQFIFKD